MQEQNAETSGSEMPETREDFDRMEREMEQRAATELGIQRERAEASGEGGTYSEASEAMIDSVQETSDADVLNRPGIDMRSEGEGTVEGLSEADRLQAEAVRLHVASDDPENDPEVAAAFDRAFRAAAASEEPQEVDFSTLSTEDQISVLFTGLYEMHARLSEVEQRLILLAQSFVRILEAAGMAEEGTQPPIEVARTMPKMATKIKPR